MNLMNTLDIELDEAAFDQELDENPPVKPSPKSKTIMVPKVQNMDDYLIKHYKPYILQELNQRLVDGQIEELVGVPVKSERILPGECCFQRFNYWRINRCDLWVDIDLRLELKIQTEAGTDTDFYWFYVELWFSVADDEEECSFETIGKISDKPEHEEAWKLDKYLVPVLRRDEIDKYSEAIWEEYFPEAAKDGKQRKPRDLAAKMGLTVTNLRLYKKSYIKGIIFFRESKVLTQPDRLPGEREDPPPCEVTVPAMTVVVNSHADSTYDFDLDVYHECIHNDWHYLFYRLQDMHNNDINQLKMTKRTMLKNQDVSNPIEFMELQARYGSYGLMMPISILYPCQAVRT